MNFRDSGHVSQVWIICAMIDVQKGSFFIFLKKEKSFSSFSSILFKYTFTFLIYTPSIQRPAPIFHHFNFVRIFCSPTSPSPLINSASAPDRQMLIQMGNKNTKLFNNGNNQQPQSRDKIEQENKRGLRSFFFRVTFNHRSNLLLIKSGLNQYQCQMLKQTRLQTQYIIMPKFELGQQAARDLPDEKPEKNHRESSAKFKLNREHIVRKCFSDLHEKYTFGDKIGEGSFGEVYKVVHKKLNITRALKIIGKTSQSSKSHNPYEELEILKKLDHPNVLKVYEYFQTENQWLIITEYFEGKELFDEIIEEKKLTERKAALIFAEVCKAVAYIHAHSIVHRDIKPENILVKKCKRRNFSPDRSSNNQRQYTDQYEYQIKLIDWGLGSRSIKQLMRKCGTPEYCAPEVLQGTYGHQCDLWSLGVLLYVMLVGRFPFKGSSVQDTLQLVRRAKLTFKSPQWSEIGPEPKYLISCLIKRQPHLRKSASQILKSEWILYYVDESKSHQSLKQLEDQQKELKETLMRLKQVTLDNKFQAVVVNFVHNYIAAEEKEKKLKKEFEMLDENKDGVLSYEELLKGYQAIYPYLAPNKLQDIVLEIFKNLDLDGSGEIEYSQFVTFATKIDKKFTEKQLREVFSLLDEDGNGRISKKQINQILMYEKGAQSQQFDDIINSIDLNGDGNIGFDQFIKNIDTALSKVIKQQKKNERKRSKDKNHKSSSNQKQKQSLSSQKTGETGQKRVTRNSLRQQMEISQESESGRVQGKESKKNPKTKQKSKSKSKGKKQKSIDRKNKQNKEKQVP